MIRPLVLAAGVALVALLSLAPRPAAAAGDGPYVFNLEPGEVADVCKTRALLCPAGAATCDDPAVARPEGRAQGLVFVAGKIGQTTCSAAGGSGAGMRRVFRVVVAPKPPDAKLEKKGEAKPARKPEPPDKSEKAAKPDKSEKPPEKQLERPAEKPPEKLPAGERPKP